MQHDKKLHLIGGVGVAVLLVLVILCALHYGPGAALAGGSVLLAFGVELYQKVRNEGTPDIEDALFSAAPGVLAGIAWQVLT